MTGVDATTTPTPAMTAPLDEVVVDLYRDVHKGIRNELFAITSRLGSVDPDDGEAVAVIADRMTWFFDLLNAHAEHEDDVIGPELVVVDDRLERRVRAEHVGLERAMVDLAGLWEEVRRADGRHARRVAVRRWYLAFASFTGAYLAHEATEELEVMPILARELGTSRIAELEQVIVSSIQPDHFAGFLGLILPATDPGERAELVGGIRAGAPAEVFEGVMALADGILPPSDLRRLVEDLAPVSL